MTPSNLGAHAECQDTRTSGNHGSNGSPQRNMQMLIRSTKNCDEMVMVTDTASIIEYVNAKFEQVTGYSSAEVIGKKACIINSGYHSDLFFKGLWSALQIGLKFSAVFTNRTKSGDIYHEEKTIRPFLEHGEEVKHFVSTGRDVSEQIQIVKRLRYLANYDSLTGLPNRNLFLDRLQQAITRATRHGSQFCLLYLDLDHFKEVNDRHSHAAGDLLLQVVADCLVTSVRDEDTVARLGGDEFSLLLEETPSNFDAEKILKKITSSLNSVGSVGNYSVRITASIGICTFPKDGKDESILMSNADTAMYRAKSRGGNNYVYFSPEDLQSPSPPLASLRRHKSKSPNGAR